MLSFLAGGRSAAGWDRMLSWLLRGAGITGIGLVVLGLFLAVMAVWTLFQVRTGWEELVGASCSCSPRPRWPVGP